MEVLGKRARPREGWEGVGVKQTREGTEGNGPEREEGRTGDLWAQRQGRKIRQWADLGEYSGQSERLGTNGNKEGLRK